VKAARASAIREQDRIFALDATRTVLEELGYELGEDFVTVVASSEGVLLPLAVSPEHGVRVRERSGELMFNVVRFDESGGTNQAQDVTAAAAFCEGFAEIVEHVGSHGVELKRVVHFDPGSGHLEVRAEPSPFVKERSTGRRTNVQPRERRR
jgi:hypothetical protein